MNITRDYSSKYIRVYEEFNNSNVVSTRHLGVTALNELAQIPIPERTKEHTTSKGETKTPDEMTVRELRELKKQLKKSDAFIGCSFFIYNLSKPYILGSFSNSLNM